MIRHFIFDLDGVIVDSANGILECLVKAYKQAGVKDCGKPSKRNVGPPVAKIIETLTPGLPPEIKQKIIGTFRNLYDPNPCLRTKVYGGVRKLLGQLTKQGCKLYIATNKPQAPSLIMLNKFKLISYFSQIIAIDSKTPTVLNKTLIVREIMRSNTIDEREAVMVGDGESDMLAATENNIASVAILNGYGDPECLRALNPTFCVQNAVDILKLNF